MSWETFHHSTYFLNNYFKFTMVKFIPFDAHLVWAYFFYFSCHPTRPVVASHPVTSNCIACLSMCHSYILLGKCSDLLIIFLIEKNFCCLLSDFKNSLYNLDISPLSGYMIYKYSLALTVLVILQGLISCPKWPIIFSESPGSWFFFFLV